MVFSQFLCLVAALPFHSSRAKSQSDIYFISLTKIVNLLTKADYNYKHLKNSKLCTCITGACEAETRISSLSDSLLAI